MINVMKSAATEAGTILLNYYKKNLTLNYKTSHKDFYTIADVESQKVIKEIITKLLLKKAIGESEIGFIGEENLNVSVNKKHLFVIDPLDGTTNFASGFDFFSISIGYFYEGLSTAGLIYRPTTKDFYYAQKNKGAYKNSQPLKIVKKPLKECLFDGVVSSRPDKYPGLFKSFEKIFPYVSGFRSIFSMALSNCLLAENIFNIVVNGHTFIWDISAAKLIIEESGGIMMDFKGLPVNFDLNNPKLAYNTISCHPRLKSEILKFF
ncbi:MAG: Inositol-1-monophosphatase [Candidatus Roizmanbacteria bacterium GW2011_GWA2_33_33]|uniref:Inositol-1-monophosphatase n=2 Tax=Candidatus Roizmaniibacteriota TaxID=1752723 RepID=A0A0G0AWE8_9BACT|nr:MAG: Inositol-1-monophosphatase [Candidatus Roizmanbacteria bacterium GW2011_GWA2_33_33]KKP61374.1 MAG: Inositol-1-monophosphatase [Candidatus Roizmanbacteria bacterium GW2011_GWC2_34_23]